MCVGILEPDGVGASLTWQESIFGSQPMTSSIFGDAAAIDDTQTRDFGNQDINTNNNNMKSKLNNQ